MTLDTLSPIEVEYGRYKEKMADEFLSSTNTVKGVDPASFFPVVKKAVTWDDLEDDVISELMVWEHASDQDFHFLEGLTE